MKGIKNINTKVIIEELHRAFKMFNENLFEGKLPEPAILIQSRGNKKLTLGWCTVQKVWVNNETHEEKYEINLVAEGINRGLYPVMTTLLHEMVHLHNLVNEIKDVSRGNTYHNNKFKAMAEAHGLICEEHDSKIGWSWCKLQDSTMALINNHNFDEAVFQLGRKDFGEGKEKKKKKTSVIKYTCPKCGCIIRATKLVNVICGDCFDNDGEVVRFEPELPEDFELPTDEEGEETEGTSIINPVEIEEPKEEPTEEYICKECGAVNLLPIGADHICKECGCFEMPEVVEVPTAEEPAKLIEVDTTLDDGAGNPVDVKQITVDVPQNTGWNIDRIVKVLTETAKEGEALGLESCFPNGVAVEINPKMISQWANYKEGKAIHFSKNYLESASDEEIIDTIKHEYLHHYQFTVCGLHVNHKKDFKALCETMGISKETPVKNHRAVK